MYLGDGTDFRRTELEAQLKSAIELGRTVVLVNAAPMYSSLYDVLNKHYTGIETGGQLAFYANIGIGAYSRPCRVHEDSRIVVYMALHDLPSVERPFIARFETYRLSVFDVLEEALLDLAKADVATGAGTVKSKATLAFLLTLTAP